MAAILRRRWVALLFWILGVTAAFAIVAWQDWPDDQQRLFDTQCRIAPGDSLSWPIVFETEGLRRVDVALLRDGRVSGRVALRLTADPGGERDIASAEVPASFAEDITQPVRRPYGYVPFEFAPVEHSVHGPVWLWLDSEASEPVSARCLDRGGAPQLAFKTYRAKSARRNVALFFSRLPEKRHGPLGSPWFYAAMLPVYIALVGLLLWFVAGARGWGGQDGQDRIE